jgi:hypothetical protein
MVANLTRLTHKIAIQLHLVAESCTICSFRSRQPVRKLLENPRNYKMRPASVWNIFFSNLKNLKCFFFLPRSKKERKDLISILRGSAAVLLLTDRSWKGQRFWDALLCVVVAAVWLGIILGFYPLKDNCMGLCCTKVYPKVSGLSR